jgi:hypothetical protein
MIYIQNINSQFEAERKSFLNERLMKQETSDIFLKPMKESRTHKNCFKKKKKNCDPSEKRASSNEMKHTLFDISDETFQIYKNSKFLKRQENENSRQENENLIHQNEVQKNKLFEYHQKF